MKRRKNTRIHSSKRKARNLTQNAKRSTARKPKRRRDRESDLDSLITYSPPAFESFFIEEPKLVFAQSHISVDPKTGLEQFGPPSRVKPLIRIGVIGTGSAIDALRAYLDRAQSSVSPGLNARRKQYDPVAFPDFPGVNETASFWTRFITESSIQKVIPEPLFESAVKPANRFD